MTSTRCADLGEEHGFDVVVLDDLGDGERWSSSAVRRHLAAGEVAEAAAILGRPHRMTGTVVHGAHRGRELGLPDREPRARLAGPRPRRRRVCRVAHPRSPSDRRRPGAHPAGGDLGRHQPDLRRHPRTVEAYVLDRTDLDLYDEEVTVEFVDHIRPTLRFDSVEELLDAMAGDIEKCRQVLASIVPS